jgi:DNA/RNA endonuclease G (NUC1)
MLRTAIVATVPVTAALMTLALAGCGERDASTTFQRHVAAPAESDGSIDTGIGGRPAQERGSNDPLRYAFYGLPQGEPLETPYEALFNQGYVVGYDFSRRAPAWACYRLFSPDQSAASKKRDERVGTADPRVAQPAAAPADKDAKPRQDYDRSSGVAPRLLVPASALATCYGDEAAAEAHLSSNQVPASVNADPAWDQVAALEPQYAKAYNEVWVACGPLYGEGAKTLPSGTAIPDGFWKVQFTVQDGVTHAQGFIFPATAPEQKDRKGIDPAARLVPIAEIEDRTGLTFLSDFHDVDDSETRHLLETTVPAGLWGTEAAPDKPVPTVRTAAARSAKPAR